MCISDFSCTVHSKTFKSNTLAFLFEECSSRLTKKWKRNSERIKVKVRKIREKFSCGKIW